MYMLHETVKYDARRRDIKILRFNRQLIFSDGRHKATFNEFAIVDTMRAADVAFD